MRPSIVMQARQSVLEIVGGWNTDLPALADRFRDAAPFPHVVIDGFLREETCRALLDEFPRWEVGNSLDENGRPGGKSVVEAVRRLGPGFAALDRLIADEAFLALVGEVSGIEGLCYDPEYVGGGTHENRVGQDLDFHVDFNRHPRGWHRRLNLLLYLNPQWDEAWGGCLELRPSPRAPGPRVAPLYNRAVLFETSGRSWHGFDRLRPPDGVTRRSIALYFYTPSPPPGRTHSTIYIEQPLPAEATVEELRRLTGRRRAHLERLLARDRELLELLARLSQQALAARAQPFDAERRAQIEAPLTLADELLEALYAREARLREAVDRALELPRVRADGPIAVERQAGLWHDGWVGARLEVVLSVTAPVVRLVVRGSIPGALARQTLVLRAGDVERRVTLAPGAFAWEVALALPPGTHTVEVTAAETFSPRQRGESDDARPLAWLLDGISAA